MKNLNIESTGIEIMTFALVETMDFLVDHPFYFALVDKSSTLFTGRIANFWVAELHGQ